VRGAGRGRGWGARGRNSPTMYAHMNKWIKKKRKEGSERECVQPEIQY
jgi:hypothetical protein